MESDTSVFDAIPMRILPDSCVEIVLHYQDPYSETFRNSTYIEPRSFIVTQMKNYMEIKPNGKTGFVSIRLSAKGAYHFFGFPMKEIAGVSTDLKNAWNKLSSEIEDKINSCSSTLKRIEIIQHYLSAQLSRHYRPNKTIDYCIEEIHKEGGQISIEDLARKTGLSDRQLLRNFDQCVGLSPKEFARIVKFNTALRYMQNHCGSTLLDAAHTCGYYDQAHFIRDFKEYSGLTPTEYLQSENVFF